MGGGAMNYLLPLDCGSLLPLSAASLLALRISAGGCGRKAAAGCRSPRAVVLGFIVALVTGAHADSLVLKSGQVVTGKSFRRNGDQIMVTTEIQGPDGKPMNAERGTPLAD